MDKKGHLSEKGYLFNAESEKGIPAVSSPERLYPIAGLWKIFKAEPVQM
jgi:hypothetical protein